MGDFLSKGYFFSTLGQRGLGRVTVRVLGQKKLSHLQRRLQPIRPGKKQRWLPYILFALGDFFLPREIFSYHGRLIPTMGYLPKVYEVFI